MEGNTALWWLLNILSLNLSFRASGLTFVNRKNAVGTELHSNDSAVSKVTESRWVGQSPNSRCFIPSRSINSSWEDGEPELMLRLATFHQFLGQASSNPTLALCLMGDTAGRASVECDAKDGSPWSGIKKIVLRSHWQPRVQTVFLTTVKPYTHKNTHIRAQEPHMVTQTHSLCCT